MALGDLEADRQAEAGALADLLGGEERVEDPRQHLFRDAMAVVGDVDRHVAGVAHAGANADLSARLRRGLRGVGYQVEQHLVDLGGRASYRGDVAEGLLHRALADQVLRDAQRALDALVQVDRGHLAAVEAAEVLEVRHQLGDAADAVQAVLELRFQRVEALFLRERAQRRELLRQRAFVGLLRGEQREQPLGLFHDVPHVADAGAHRFQARLHIGERRVHLVGEARHHLAERRHLFALHQHGLGLFELVQRLGELARALGHAAFQAGVGLAQLEEKPGEDGEQESRVVQQPAAVEVGLQHRLRGRPVEHARQRVEARPGGREPGDVEQRLEFRALRAVLPATRSALLDCQ